MRFKEEAKVLGVFFGGFMLLSSVPVLAGQPNYDTLDIEYAGGNYDDGQIEFDTTTGVVRASAQAFGNFYVHGSYEYGELDVQNLPGNVGDGLNISTLIGGVGGFVHLTDGASGAVGLDLAGDVFFIRTDLEESTDSGWGASIGPRLRIGSRVQLQAAATYYDVGADGVWEFGVRGVYDFTPLVAIQAGVRVDEEGDSFVYTLGTRLNLGD